MTELKRIPLTGQGKPLPPDFPYTGECLHENCLFLYRSQSAQTLEDTDPEMTVVVPAPNGKTFVGFNSIPLAMALHMESEQVFEHNRARTLCVVDAQIAPVMTLATDRLLGKSRLIFGIQVEIGAERAVNRRRTRENVIPEFS